MSYALDPLEPLSEGVHRILVDQSRDAIRALSRKDRERGVHDARKAAKRCRALLAAIRPGLTPEAFRLERDRFRDAARAIGTARDADVRLRTFDAISRGEFPAIREALLATRAEVDPAAIEVARARFAEAPAIPLEIATDDMLAGVAHTYQRMREASRHEGSVEAIHEWRRRTKEHLHHLQLLSSAWPAVLGAMAKDADRLQEELGLWHDHAVLRGWLDAAGLLEEQVDARLIAAMDDHLHRTGGYAPKLGAMKASALEKWLDRLWR